MYSCLRHGNSHVCDGVDRPDDPHPVIFVNENSEHICGFSALVVGVNSSRQDYSDDVCSSKTIDEGTMGMRGGIYEGGAAPAATDITRQGRTGRCGDGPVDSVAKADCRRKAASTAASAARGVYDDAWCAKLEQVVRRTLQTLTNAAARGKISREHDDKAFAEFATADKKYARASRRAHSRMSRLLREVCAERIARKHRRCVPSVDPRSAARWCRDVVCLWKLFIGASPADRMSMPDACTPFIIGCLYGMAEGISHDRTGHVLYPPDPELEEVLPPPQDLSMLGVQQRTRSNGQKQLYRLVANFVVAKGDPEKACSEVRSKLSEGCLR